MWSASPRAARSAGCAANGGIPGLNYRSEAPFDDWIGAHTWRASASYVTGAHSMKFGYSGAWHEDQQKNFPNSTYTAYHAAERLGVVRGPDELTREQLPGRARSRETLTRSRCCRTCASTRFYAQEQYTTGRFTFQGAVRFDHAWSYFPDETIGACGS